MGNQPPVLPGSSPTSQATQIPFPKGSPHSNRKPALPYQPLERTDRSTRASSIPKDYKFLPKQEPGSASKKDHPVEQSTTDSGKTAQKQEQEVEEQIDEQADEQTDE